MDDENRITYFAATDARNRKISFGIKAKDRTKHVYVIGKTGMGKSTLLENMAIQDIKNGEGLAFIDPHGKTAELLLDYIPKERIADVLYFAPFDTDFPIAFNIMEDVGYDKRHLVVSGLMSAFEKIWADQWSSRMAHILQNTLLALLEYPDATLLSVNRMYTDKVYRNKVVDNIKDATVKAFWTEEYAKYSERYVADATPAIQNKIGQFTSNPVIRNIVGQAQSSFDLRDLMDKKKIVIINLSKGKVGETNAKLLGSILITKIYLSAMSRADVTEAELQKLPNFYLYVDEFQSFANRSFADILSEARKYKLNLTMAHQYIEQMEEEVRSAVFGNVGTMITFRVGAFDAEVLEKELAPVFTAEDLVNLGFTQIYLKLMIDGVTSPPFSATTLPPITRTPETLETEIITSSRSQFAEPRDKIEEAIKDWYGEAAPVSEEKARSSSSRSDSSRREPKSRRNSDSGRSRNQSSQDELKNVMAEALKRAEAEKATAPPPSAPIKPDDKRFASLKEVKKDKGPTEKNLSQLRDTLNKIVGESGSNERVEKASNEPVKKEPIVAKANKEPKPNTESKNKKEPAKNEVPKDVLLKILDMDESR